MMRARILIAILFVAAAALPARAQRQPPQNGILTGVTAACGYYGQMKAAMRIRPDLADSVAAIDADVAPVCASIETYADDSTKRDWIAGKANELRQMRDPGQ